MLKRASASCASACAASLSWRIQAQRRQQREAPLGRVAAGQEVAAQHHLAARAQEGVVDLGRFVVALLPVRALAQQFQALAGPAVEPAQQLVVVGRADEIAARGHLAEIGHARADHPAHRAPPAAGAGVAAGAAAGAACAAGSPPATRSGNCSPRCQSPPPCAASPARRTMRISTGTDTPLPVQVMRLESSRRSTWPAPIKRLTPFEPGALNTSTVLPSPVTAVIFTPGTWPTFGYCMVVPCGGVLR
ncbi:hypothetical protein G6F22_015754 [Rhizopus arrhizus]|nr:hypothetical protein G6F22_015754 [Rhizopus arrhizus]